MIAVEIKLKLTSEFIGLLRAQMTLKGTLDKQQTPMDALAIAVLGEAMGAFYNDTYSKIGFEWRDLIDIVPDERKVTEIK